MKQRILLIGHTAEVRESFGARLAEQHDVSLVATAEEALAAFEDRDSYAVVICSQTSDVDGIELLTRIREQWPDTVRILTAEAADTDFLLRVVNEGEAFRFLLNPDEGDGLLTAVEDALERHRQTVLDFAVNEQLTFAKESLKCLTEDLEDRVSVQMTTLRVLHKFAVDLNATGSLAGVAAQAARATYEATQKRGVHVQLWDDDAAGGAVEAFAGPEMSSHMHREILEGPEGPVGEIVVDVYGGDGSELGANDYEVLTMIAVPTAVAARNELRRRERDQAQHSTILALARLSEHRDNETGKHIERVSLYCKLVAETLRERGDYLEEITDDFIVDLVRSAPLHDIGKVGIPDSILLKPGKLSPSEWEIMKTHAEVGAKTLEEVIQHNKNPGYLIMGRDIAGCHHEKWDGTGYPKGLKGLDIPLSARILALADIYDALTTERPYKEAWPHEKAYDWITSLGGTQLDERVVLAFIACAEEADRIRAQLADDPEEIRELVKQA